MPLSRRTLIGSSLAAATAVAVRPAHAAANVLRIGISTSLNTLDPMMVTTGDEYIYANLVFNGLARMREDLVVEPDLAESWSFSDDLKRWTFRLRRGVKFHDGQEMVADDVVASFPRPPRPARQFALPQPIRHGRERLRPRRRHGRVPAHHPLWRTGRHPH